MDLVLINADGSERRQTISEKLTVGRDVNCDFVVSEGRVSREHFILLSKDGHVFIEDSSSNGTRLNGQLIQSCQVHVGDVIDIGQQTRFHLQETRREDLESSYKTLSLETSEIGPRLPLDQLEQHMDRLFEYIQALQIAHSPEGILKAAKYFLSYFVDVDRLFLVIGQGAGFRSYQIEDGDIDKKIYKKPLVTTVIERSWKQRQGVLARVALGELQGSVSADVTQINSVIVVPIIDGQGEILGALYADRMGQGAHFSFDDLKILAQAALPMSRSLEACVLHMQLQRHQKENELIGSSAAINKLKNEIDRVACVDSSILLEGPSGSGKRLVAKMIHDKSGRRFGPFVVIDASSLTPSLVTSELFGHVMGAFTGADQDRLGAFDRAHGGTLLIHHVDELSEEVQTLLLRTLESKKVRPLGGTKEHAIDVRVISTVSCHLETQVKQGNFRQDLFFRLQVITLTIPGLDQRLDDFEELIACFLGEMCQRLGRTRPRFENGFITQLKKQKWPGHVRQLRNTVEKLLVMASGDLLKNEDLGQTELEQESLLLDDVIYKHIRHVLEICSGNKSQASDILGIDRSTLYAKLKQMEKTK